MIPPPNGPPTPPHELGPASSTFTPSLAPPLARGTRMGVETVLAPRPRCPPRRSVDGPRRAGGGSSRGKGGACATGEIASGAACKNGQRRGTDTKPNRKERWIEILLHWVFCYSFLFLQIQIDLQELLEMLRLVLGKKEALWFYYKVFFGNNVLLQRFSTKTKMY